MAILLDIDGEDGGLLAGGSPWEWTSIDNDGGTNDFSLSEASAKHGTYGYQAVLAEDSGDAQGRADFTETADVYLRFSFEVDVWAGAEDEYIPIAILLNSSANTTMKFILHRTGTAGWCGYTVQVNNGASTIINKRDIDVFQIGVTYCVEIHYLSDATVGGAEVWINGYSDESSFSSNTSAYVSDELRIGIYEGYIDAGDTFYFDDIIVADAYIGPLDATTTAAPTTTTTTLAPGEATVPIISSDGIHSVIFGGQIING